VAEPLSPDRTDTEEGRRARKRRETAEALRAAAIELFVTKGFSETTVQDIADAVDVAARTFYRYFESKEEVALLEVVDYFGDVEEILEGCPPEWSPVTCLLAVVDQLEEKWSRQASELELMIDLVDSDEGLHGRLRSLTSAHQERIGAIFARRLQLDEHHPKVWALSSIGVEAFLGALVLTVRGDRTRNSFDYGEELLLLYATGVDPAAHRRRRHARDRRPKKRAAG
jgi:AcrR family transcriptional regulator